MGSSIWSSTGSIVEPESSSGFETLLENYAALVRRVGWRYRLSEADVDELMQDVRIRLWRAQATDRLRSENIEQTPASYVYRTATTAALDLIRRRRAGRASDHDSVDDVTGEQIVDFSLLSTSMPDREVEAAELAQQVEQAIETIPSSRRPVVRMYLAGYPREEIADLMGWTEAKTRNLLYRGLDDLRERLTELGIGTGGADD
jgi:RNA polymerase sigma factor (sigma-70 family)